MSITIALADCEKIEEQIDEIEYEEKRLKTAYRIFNLDMVASKDLPNIRKVRCGIFREIFHINQSLLIGCRDFKINLVSSERV